MASALDDLLAAMPTDEAARVEALFHAFTHPRHRPLTEEEQALMARAEGQVMSGQDGLFRLWTWRRPGGGPRVLLVHGWESRASHWLAWVPSLLAAGFDVAAIDGPGHGEESGKPTHVLALARATVQAARTLGPLQGLVGHSAGSAACLYAFAQGIQTRASVHISGPTHLTRVLDQVAGAALPPTLWPAFHRRFETFLGQPAADFDLPRLSVGLGRHKALLLHDPVDAEVPFSSAETLRDAWPGALLETVEGLGHRRILRAPDVVARAVGFLAV
jgi:pimeloyl-ACP methyl ester carboxylesterase